MALASLLVRGSRDSVALLTCGVFACVSFARVGYAGAQDASGAPSSSITAPGPAASGASPEPPPSSAAPSDATPPDADDSVEAPAPVSANAGGRAELERRLHALEDERVHRTNFWPWLVVGTGAGMTLIGTVVGVGYAFDCEENTRCSSPPWATVFVVAGVAIGTAGSIWLVRTDAGIRDLELETQRVRSDLDQLNHARLFRERGVARLGTRLLRLEF